MPSVELTENLRSTIRDLRKKKKKRGDELSRELGKGASYISQIENGKIKEIDFKMLDDIFQKIVDLPQDQYEKYITNILDNVISHLSKEEIQHEHWMHQFNYEMRMFPIYDEIISFISNRLEKLNYTPEELVNLINKNIGLKDKEVQEPNKLRIEIIDSGNSSYSIKSSIRFELPSNFIKKIIDKEMKTINYINMQGIIYNLFLAEGNNDKDAHEKTDNLLCENGFLTLKQRNELIRKSIKEKREKNENFTYYDVLPTDHEKKYANLLDDITDGFSFIRDNDIQYACEKLERLRDNMKDDLGFSMAIISAPYYKIENEFKKDFFNDLAKLVKTYIDKSKSESKTKE
jgi:Helix-turn-helix.